MTIKDKIIEKQRELLKLQEEAFSYEVIGEGEKIDWKLANRLQDEIASLESKIKKEQKSDIMTVNEILDKLLYKQYAEDENDDYIAKLRLLTEAMKAYHEAVNKSITDEDIKRKCEEVYGKLEYLWDDRYESYIVYRNGAKAFRDGEIKHIEDGRED